MREKPVVLYDGQCAFCRVCARVLRRLDRRRRLDLIDFNRPEADALLEPLPAVQRRTALHVADVDGTVHSAGPALRRALADALGSGAERVFTHATVAPVVDAAYRFAAANRHRLSWIEGPKLRDSRESSNSRNF